MTINAYLPRYSQEVNEIIENSNNNVILQDRLTNFGQRCFTDGINAIMESKIKTKNKNIMTKELNESLANFYVDKNIEDLFIYFINAVKDFEQNGKLQIGWEEGIKEDLKNIIKVVYDTGVSNGVVIAEDPLKLKVYLQNKKRIEDGEY